MTQALTVATNHQVIPIVSEEKLLEFLAIHPNARRLSDEQRKEFLTICQIHGLNPFKNEIYVVERKGKLCFQTGFQVYIARAERSGRLNGWNVRPHYKDGKLAAATCTIWRKDFAQPFEYTVMYDEYVQLKDGRPMALWATHPTVMLNKCAISMAFRMAFSTELTGIPYTVDEMSRDHGTVVIDGTEQVKLTNKKSVEVIGLLEQPVLVTEKTNTGVVIETQVLSPLVENASQQTREQLVENIMKNIKKSVTSGLVSKDDLAALLGVNAKQIKEDLTVEQLLELLPKTETF
jgi:phage recombination protein Bet